MRKCFTINPFRSKEDINSYEEKLVKTKLFSGCEIFYPYNTSLEQAKMYEEEILKYTRYDNFEIVLHMPYGNDNNIATNQNIDIVMNRLIKAIDFASKFNVKKLTLHPGCEDETMPRFEAIQKSIENVQKLCDYAKKYQMTIMIENLVSSKELCLTIEEIKDYIRLVNRDNCKFILDCGHYNVANHHKDLKEVVDTMKDHLVHLHLSNNNSLSDQHQNLRNGNIDFINYFKYLKEINYQGLYCSEVLFKTVDDLIKTSDDLDRLEQGLKL